MSSEGDMKLPPPPGSNSGEDSGPPAANLDGEDPGEDEEEKVAVNDSDVVFTVPDAGTPAAQALAANAELKMSATDKFIRKIRNMKGPKLKTFNIIKQIKKHTKLRRKKHRNFKGKVINGQHELYVITAGITLGIKCTLNHLKSLPSKEKDMLTLEDFNYVEKVSFPAKGSKGILPYSTPPHSLQRTFKFKSYAPKVFSRIRSLFDVKQNEYMDSICGKYDFIEFMSNSKSGQFFFYSHDGKYMLKTQTKEENKFMKLILPHYYRYMAENPHSLIVRFLGMHRVKMYQFRRKVHFVIMNSVFDTPEEIHTMYDLKGSTYGRAATDKERNSGGVLKDLDLLSDKRKFHLGGKRDAFLAQLKRDADFLASLGIMDYSLLVGIHFKNRRQAIPMSLNTTGGGGDDDSVISQSSTGSKVVHSNTPLRRAAKEAQLKDQNNPGDALNTEIILQGGDDTHSNAIGTIEEGGEDDLSDVGIDDVIAAADGMESDDDASQISFESINSIIVEGQSADDGGLGLTSEILLGSTSAKASAKGAAVPDLYYRDSNGLKSPEGERLSRILSPRDFSSGPVGTKTAFATYNNTESNMIRASIDQKDLSIKGDVSDDDDDDDDDEEEEEGGESRKQVEGRLMQKRKIRHPWTNRPDSGINSRESFGERSTPRSGEIYYCGIIDILQQYNFHKNAETVIKALYLDVSTISSVDPYSYADRFVDFIDKNSD